MAHDFTGDFYIGSNMKIITREEAKKQGLTRFFTGEACKNGHIFERKVSNYHCIKCHQEENKKYMKKYYKNNSKSIKEYVKKYKENNRDKCNALEMKRYTKKKQRTPSWIDDEELFLIQEAYSLAKLREKFTGIEWQVDHIVPLQGKIVSGFHVPSNLQVIPRIENQSKHAKWDWDEQ